MKPTLERCNRLIDDGLSLIPVGEDKVPIIKWKIHQTEPMSKDVFHNFYSLEKTKGIGIVCGYQNLEIIDVDLKVLKTQTERDEFWNEYLSLLQDNILDFENKFVIVKTKNAGFHILYKCKKIVGNTKIAKLEGHTEAIIESRGIGGYSWVYTQFVQKNSYRDIIEISEEDREILWTISKMYNHIEPTKEKVFTEKKDLVYEEVAVKVWDDFNSKNSIFDLIRGEFSIVRKLSNKTLIKREGAKSAHSGYIFENSKCMYLFSTGTIYPNEKLLSPFSVYAYQKHGGNLSEAAKDLYKQGYGERIKKVTAPTTNVIEKQIIETVDFPIDVFPSSIQNYIFEVHKTLNASVDYLGSAVLWVLSLCVGNSMKIEVKKGWIECGVIWLAIVGKAGIGKTHNIDAITRPLVKVNEREIKRYKDNCVKYEEYKQLDKKEKELSEKINEPRNSQFIVGDVTYEALVDIHSENLNGIGVLRDELSGWIKDLNKYRQGSDLENYLSCWSNGMINSNRKTSKSGYVSKACVPIIGGVQPSILTLHYTPENKDNGFIDRFLLCYPDLKVEKYNTMEMSDELLEWYNNYIISLFDNIRNSWLKYDELGNIIPFLARYDNEANKEWIRIFNKITDLQNSEDENEYMKSMLPKQKSYICRFALLLNVLYSFNDDTPADVITKRAILGAEKLSEYFIKMAKKNKFESIENSEINSVIKASGGITAKDQFQAIFKADPKLNRTKIADKLNVSRHTILNWIKELEKL